MKLSYLIGKTNLVNYIRIKNSVYKLQMIGSDL